MNTNTEIKILRIKQLTEKLSIGKSTIYDWLNPKSPRYDETFPKPIKLGGNAVGWICAHVDEWVLKKYSQIDPTK